jgi:urocanate hydratase
MATKKYPFLDDLTQGIPLSPLPPSVTHLDPSVPHAPKRPVPLSIDEKKIAIRNALRYFPSQLHELLAPEFAEELEKYGHIYMYRFRPRYEMKAYPLNEYPAKCVQARCIQLMIQNNLDPRVAQYPHELITYGGNGAVFQNWAQYHLVMQYLSKMRDDETLVIYSGHPLGLFPSTPEAPRVIITNGMVVPHYSTRELFDKMYALGVTQYGQMTAGSYCYIGPQGIVHGTTLTIVNAALKYLGTTDLCGKVFVSSGLGGMSGAQAKAGVIAGLIAVIAEVDERAIVKRSQQGWVKEVYRDIDQVICRLREARANKESTSIAYHGNVVTLWEKLASLDEMLVDLGSDQTSLHNPFNGGYYPVQLTFEEANAMMVSNPSEFKSLAIIFRFLFSDV